MEDNFKILSFRHTYGNLYNTYPSTGEDIYMVHPDATKHTREDFFKYPDLYSIHSIKNMDSGVVITVKDYIYRTDKNYVEKIFIGGDGRFRLTVTTPPNALYTQRSNILAVFAKPRTSLFKSLDGEDIYLGDKVYQVDRDTFDIRSSLVERLSFPKSRGTRFFSCNGAALDYAVHNKPFLSLKMLEGYFSPEQLEELSKNVKIDYF